MKDNRDQSDAVSIVVVSAWRSSNIGDQAMLEAAIKFLRHEINRDVSVTVLGPPRGFDLSSAQSVMPISDSLLPGLRQLKYAWEIIAHRSTVGNRSLWGRLTRFASRFLTRGIILSYLALFAVLLLSRWFLRIPIPRRQADCCDSIFNADTIITSGGGWINSSFTLTMYEQLFVLWIAARFLNKPIYLLGEQVGPIDNWFDRIFLRAVLVRARLTGVRDPVSMATVESMMDSRVNATLFGDWAYDADKQGADQREERESGLVTRIGLHMRSSHYSPIDEACLNTIVSALRARLFQGNVEIHLIPTCVGRHESDISVFERLQTSLEGDANLFSYDEFSSTSECAKVVGSMDLNIGVSYHFCLFSLMHSRPVIAIAYSDYYRQKLYGLFDLYEARSDVIPGETISAKLLLQKISELEVRLCAASAKLVTANQSLTEQFASAKKQTSDAIGSKLSTQLDEQPTALH